MIETNRLLLRPFVTQDAADLLEYRRELSARSSVSNQMVKRNPPRMAGVHKTVLVPAANPAGTVLVQLSVM